MKIDKELYAKLITYTGTDYEPYQRSGEDYVMLDDNRISAIIDDLLIELSYRDEKIQDMEDEMKDFADGKIDEYTYRGLNKNDFF